MGPDITGRQGKKALLIAPWHEDGGDRVPLHLNKVRFRPPSGLLTVAAVLEEDGFDVEILDTRVEKDYRGVIEERLTANKYLFIGITVSLGISSALKKAEEIQSCCKGIDRDVPFVWGGFFPSCLPALVFERYKPDFIVRFEGEDTIRELARLLLKGERKNSIRGLSWRDGDSVINNGTRGPAPDLDRYPIPAWHLLKGNLNRQQTPYYANVISSLGCPYNCSFCYYRAFEDGTRPREWRARSAVHLMEELKRINGLSGIDVFTFEDDNFLVDKKRAREIFTSMRKNKFYAEKIITNINNLDRDIIGAMEGLVNEVVCSVESASRRMRPILRKALDIERMEETARELFEHGINMTAGFMFGLPAERDDDRKENVEFMRRIKEINPFIRPSVTVFKPLPGTDIIGIIEGQYGKLPFMTDDYYERFDWSVHSGFMSDTKDYFFDHAEQVFIVEFARLFKTVFSPSNAGERLNAERVAGTNRRLRDIFGDLGRYRWLGAEFKPYLLDRVLKNEKIDLVNDLRAQAARLA